MWNQRSWVLWMSKGDSNPKYFHNKATGRFLKNSILGIRDDNDQWHEQPEEIGRILVRCYDELFKTQTHGAFSLPLDFIPQIVTDDMNAQLVRTFQEWEMVNDLKQMAPLKAPSSDGMPPIFYQHFWQVVDQEQINPNASRNTIKGMFEVQEIKFYKKYLDLPSLVGREKKASFNYIKEHIWRKLQRWKGMKKSVQKFKGHLEPKKPNSSSTKVLHHRIAKDHFEEFKAISPTRTPPPRQT
ncbi:hypothetical protein SO802_023300 [Lithocarpus litseifolius]|uniref:Reverse transcriptase n=1 Tax=Lithocarpus litseifolius TaxID=425828 RepID=A0AAW2C6C0_9ROSI